MPTADEAARRWARSVIGSHPRPEHPEGHAAYVAAHEHWRGGARWRLRCECGVTLPARATFGEANLDRLQHWGDAMSGTLF